MKKLWLFDIDGTLVNINPIHLACYKNTYRKYLQRDVDDDLILSTFGMTEFEMHRKIFAELKIPFNEELIHSIVNEHPESLKSSLGETQIEPLGGAVEFLSYLEKNGEYLGVVTGNLEVNAHLILEKAGLKKYFSIVSCDDGKSQRWQVVQRAVEKARKKDFDFDKVIVVGDTVQDVEAGKKVGGLTVAVATGSQSFEVLQSAKPTLVVKDLKLYKKIIQIAC